MFLWPFSIEDLCTAPMVIWESQTPTSFTLGTLRTNSGNQARVLSLVTKNCICRTVFTASVYS